MSAVFHLLRPLINQLPWRTGAKSMGAPTSISEIFETLEDGAGFKSLLRFLIPTLFDDLPGTPKLSGFGGHLPLEIVRMTL